MSGHRRRCPVLLSGCSSFGWAWWSAGGLVVDVGVEDELAEELSFWGDDSDVEVGDEDDDGPRSVYRTLWCSPGSAELGYLSLVSSDL